MSKSYEPISCHTYDDYVLLVQRKQALIFRESDGEIEIVVMSDLYTKDKVEYAKFSNNKVLVLNEFKVQDGEVVIADQKNTCQF